MDKILLGGLDTTVADIVIQLSKSRNALRALIEYGKAGKFNDNDKFKISDSEYVALSELIADIYKEPSAGGTIANILNAFISILGQDSVSAEIVSLPGIKKNGRAVRDEAKKSGITIVPGLTIDEAETINTPVSYILINDLSPDHIKKLEAQYSCELPFLKKHKKFVLRNDGSGAKFLQTHDNIQEGDKSHEPISVTLIDSIRENTAKSDIIFMTGSSTRKFSVDAFKAQLNYAIQNGKPVVFILPTHNAITSEEAKLYWQAMKYAKVIVGNKNELRNVYHGIFETDMDKGHAIRDLRKQFELGLKCGRKQMAFITDDEKPVTILYPDARKKHCLKTDVAPREIPKKDIVSSLGAGDNTIAAFLAAIFSRFSPRDAGRIAMHIAEAVLKIIPAQLPDANKVFNFGIETTGSRQMTTDRFKDIILSPASGRQK